MAEFTPTQEEKDANSYLDWPDEALGKFTKYVALKFAETSGRQDGLHKVTSASCAMNLVHASSEMNSAKTTLNLDGMSIDGEPIGDWLVTIERIDSGAKG
jgi:hypothetical protein